MKKTIETILKEYQPKLDRLDLELIIANSLAKTREFVLTHPEHKPTGAQIAKIDSFAHRRVKHEPLAYILGYKEFYGLNFKVTADTLVPRPETELIVEEVLKLKPKNKNIIDVGAGSGNIIISLAKNIKDKNNFIAVDISGKALSVAKQNAKANQVFKKIKFIQGNLLDKIKNINNSILVANLPYLNKDWKNLLKSSDSAGLKFEPETALYGGDQDGLGIYRQLADKIKMLKPKNVLIFCEIGHTQVSEMKKIFSSYKKIEFHKDLSGKWRVCKIECV
ncbi:MAG: ribosomal protein L11 methyltransferase [uncultured bacterium]|nr:MAG: ribosomal protein L11 methyltransferase [uncultured bacterium]HBR71201.1 peptide chain release factor N(5)-glutamine methyltransferase [Candidatus Moranbacteria bacterium]